jgi:hypothetical protein
MIPLMYIAQRVHVRLILGPRCLVHISCPLKKTICYPTKGDYMCYPAKEDYAVVYPPSTNTSCSGSRRCSVHACYPVGKAMWPSTSHRPVPRCLVYVCYLLGRLTWLSHYVRCRCARPVSSRSNYWR